LRRLRRRLGILAKTTEIGAPLAIPIRWASKRRARSAATLTRPSILPPTST
jgi:hypothetical protein